VIEIVVLFRIDIFFVGSDRIGCLPCPSSHPWIQGVVGGIWVISAIAGFAAFVIFGLLFAIFFYFCFIGLSCIVITFGEEQLNFIWTFLYLLAELEQGVQLQLYFFDHLINHYLLVQIDSLQQSTRVDHLHYLFIVLL